MMERLISFEGPDGAGKTSVLQEIVPKLEQLIDGELLVTREPGGVGISEAIREIILDINHTDMDQKTELLLYIAARRQHWVEKVLPSLARGSVVLMDRFIDSSIAYQGYGRGLSQEAIHWLNDYATDGNKPGLTVYFDVPSEIGLDRISQSKHREVNRLDLEAIELHQSVRQGYLALASQSPERIVTVDASRPFDEVVSEVEQLIRGYLGV